MKPSLVQIFRSGGLKAVTLALISDMSADARTFNAAADTAAMREVLGAADTFTLMAFSSGSYGLCGPLITFSSGTPEATLTFPNLESMTDPVVLIGGSGLTSLGFSNGGYNGAFSLASTASLGNVRHLSFSQCTYQGEFKFINTSGLTKLETLSIGNSSGSSFSVFHSTGLTSLREITFYYVANGGNFTFAPTAALPALEDLSFTKCGTYGDFSIPSFANLTSVKRLTFDECCAQSGVFTFGSFSALTSIEELTFRNSVALTVAAMTISGMPALKKLNILNEALSHADVTIAALPSLETLAIGSQTCGGASLKVNLTGMAALESINIEYDRGYPLIFSGDGATEVLESIYLYSTNGLTVSDSRMFSNVTSLSLSTSGVVNIVDTVNVLAEDKAFMLLTELDGNEAFYDSAITLKVSGTSTLRRRQ